MLGLNQNCGIDIKNDEIDIENVGLNERFSPPTSNTLSPKPLITSTFLNSSTASNINIQDYKASLIKNLQSNPVNLETKNNLCNNASCFKTENTDKPMKELNDEINTPSTSKYSPNSFYFSAEMFDSTTPTAISTPVGNLNTSNSSVDDREERPSLSYKDLIIEAIESSPEKRLKLSEIYQVIRCLHPYYSKRADQWGWQNSIRHNLSLHDCFIKLPLKQTSASGIVGHFWTVVRDLDEKQSVSSRRKNRNSKNSNSKTGKNHNLKHENINSNNNPFNMAFYASAIASSSKSTLLCPTSSILTTSNANLTTKLKDRQSVSSDSGVLSDESQSSSPTTSATTILHNGIMNGILNSNITNTTNSNNLQNNSLRKKSIFSCSTTSVNNSKLNLNNDYLQSNASQFFSVPIQKYANNFSNWMQNNQNPLLSTTTNEANKNIGNLNNILQSNNALMSNPNFLMQLLEFTTKNNLFSALLQQNENNADVLNNLLFSSILNTNFPTTAINMLSVPPTNRLATINSLINKKVKNDPENLNKIDNFMGNLINSINNNSTNPLNVNAFSNQLINSNSFPVSNELQQLQFIQYCQQSLLQQLFLENSYNANNPTNLNNLNNFSNKTEQLAAILNQSSNLQLQDDLQNTLPSCNNNKLSQVLLSKLANVISSSKTQLLDSLNTQNLNSSVENVEFSGKKLLQEPSQNLIKNSLSNQQLIQNLIKNQQNLQLQKEKKQNNFMETKSIDMVNQFKKESTLASENKIDFNCDKNAQNSALPNNKTLQINVQSDAMQLLLEQYMSQNGIATTIAMNALNIPSLTTNASNHSTLLLNGESVVSTTTLSNKACSPDAKLLQQ